MIDSFCKGLVDDYFYFEMFDLVFLYIALLIVTFVVVTLVCRCIHIEHK